MVFVGHVNVEVCSPRAANAFGLGARFYESRGEKMDTIQKFLDFMFEGDFDKTIDALVASGELSKAEGDKAKDSKSRLKLLDPKGNPDVYYGRYPAGHPLEGHIAPRFSVKISRLSFEGTSEAACWMEMHFNKFFSAYAGLLNPAKQVFSAGYQEKRCGV